MAVRFGEALHHPTRDVKAPAAGHRRSASPRWLKTRVSPDDQPRILLGIPAQLRMNGFKAFAGMSML
jgi:hypothetical protein